MLLSQNMWASSRASSDGRGRARERPDGCAYAKKDLVDYYQYMQRRSRSTSRLQYDEDIENSYTYGPRRAASVATVTAQSTRVIPTPPTPIDDADTRTESPPPASSARTEPRDSRNKPLFELDEDITFDDSCALRILLHADDSDDADDADDAAETDDGGVMSASATSSASGVSAVSLAPTSLTSSASYGTSLGTSIEPSPPKQRLGPRRSPSSTPSHSPTLVRSPSSIRLSSRRTSATEADPLMSLPPVIPPSWVPSTPMQTQSGLPMATVLVAHEEPSEDMYRPSPRRMSGRRSSASSFSSLSSTSSLARSAERASPPSAAPLPAVLSFPRVEKTGSTGSLHKSKSLLTLSKIASAHKVRPPQPSFVETTSSDLLVSRSLPTHTSKTTGTITLALQNMTPKKPPMATPNNTAKSSPNSAKDVNLPPFRYVANSQHLLMYSLEYSMISAGKITSPLKPRGVLVKRRHSSPMPAIKRSSLSSELK